jgi:hypothetical protein
MSRTYLLLGGRTAKVLAALAVATLVAGCGSGGSSGSSGSDPSAATGSADGTAQTAFNTQLADQHSGSKAAGASALLATTTTPATSVASAPAAKTPAPVTVTTVKPVTHIHVVTTPGRTVYVNRKVPPRIITRTRTKVVTHTVTRTVASPVPSGPFTPSTHPALAQTRFMVPGGNLGCELSATGARCDIVRRHWTPPAQPSNCSSTFGNAIQLSQHGMASFACGGHSAISSGSEVVPVGRDDKIGHVTCEVRRFGLNCFSTVDHGFIISRTGYTLY